MSIIRHDITYTSPPPSLPGGFRNAEESVDFTVSFRNPLVYL